MKNVTPGAWFTASVFIERTRQISSAIEPMCGNIALMSMPPTVALDGLDRRLARPLLVAGRHRRQPGRAADGFGDVLAAPSPSIGLWSKRSTCDGPPPCQSRRRASPSARNAADPARLGRRVLRGFGAAASSCRAKRRGDADASGGGAEETPRVTRSTFVRNSLSFCLVAGSFLGKGLVDVEEGQAYGESAMRAPRHRATLISRGRSFEQSRGRLLIRW